MAYVHSADFDYDTYRSIYSDTPEKEFPRIKKPAKISSWGLSLVVICGAVLVVLSLGYYSLRFIPSLSIKQVEIETSSNSQLPRDITHLAEQLVGQALYGRSIKEFEQQLLTYNSISALSITKKGRSVISHIELITPLALLKDSSGRTLALTDECLVPLQDGHDSMFRSVPVIHISTLHGDYITRYGLDTGLQEALMITQEMGLDEHQRLPIIGEITYSGRHTSSFGSMTIELPAYHSTLLVKEVVTMKQLLAAFEMIKADYLQSPVANIALMKQLRYDLYNSALVKRV
ncbi:MAG: hypothetical protein ACOX0W_07720 [Sphaerochaetaceae bacterium]